MVRLLKIPWCLWGLSCEIATIKVDMGLWSSFLKDVGGNKLGNASFSIMDTCGISFSFMRRTEWVLLLLFSILNRARRAAQGKVYSLNIREIM